LPLTSLLKQEAVREKPEEMPCVSFYSFSITSIISLFQ
jgi:hypothetical protein